MGWLFCSSAQCTPPLPPNPCANRLGQGQLIMYDGERQFNVDRYYHFLYHISLWPSIHTYIATTCIACMLRHGPVWTSCACVCAGFTVDEKKNSWRTRQRNAFAPRRFPPLKPVDSPSEKKNMKKKHLRKQFLMCCTSPLQWTEYRQCKTNIYAHTYLVLSSVRAPP